MISVISILLLAILLSINVKALIDILRNRMSALDPYALISTATIGQTFPQLYVIFTNSYYNKSILPVLLFMMITCQIAFEYGLRNGRRKMPNGQALDFPKNINWLIIAFSIIGYVPMLFYGTMDSVYGGINVILGQLRSLGQMALILSLACLIIRHNFRRKNLLYVVVISTAIPLFYYAYFVKGSRQNLFALSFIAIYFTLIRYPKYKRVLSLAFLTATILGNVLSVSMTEIRRVNNYHEEGATALENIDYWENFKTSMTDRNLSMGMDLGNGAIMMGYVFTHATYDFGAGIWNKFVYNYVPSRLIGTENKNLFYITTDEVTTEKEDEIKCGTTYLPSYYDVFKMLSFAGAILFGFLGYTIARFEAYAPYSIFYTMVYVTCVIRLPNMLVGGLQYILAPLELIFILLMPLFILCLVRRRIGSNNYPNSL